MSREKILVPLGRPLKALKSVHYALALAERIPAQVFVLEQSAEDGTGPPSSDLPTEALLELMNGARQEGITISHLVTGPDLAGEIVSLSSHENIELVVFSAEDWDCMRVIAEVRPFVAGHIIQVRGRNPLDRR